MAAFLAPSRLLVGLGRPRLPLAARRRRDRLDRLVLLLHRARPPPRPRLPTRATPPRGVGGRGLGDPRRRLLPDREVPGRAEQLPPRLYWFKWEAYTTWLSGFALLVVVYFAHASSFLVDSSVADLTTARGDRDRCRRARPRLGRLRRPLPDARGRAAARARRAPGSSSSPPGAPPSCSPRAPPTSRSARCSARSWPRTSSS